MSDDDDDFVVKPVRVKSSKSAHVMESDSSDDIFAAQPRRLASHGRAGVKDVRSKSSKSAYVKESDSSDDNFTAHTRRLAAQGRVTKNKHCRVARTKHTSDARPVPAVDVDGHCASKKIPPTEDARRQLFGDFAPLAMDLPMNLARRDVYRRAQGIAHLRGYQISQKSGANNNNITLCCPARVSWQYFNGPCVAAARLQYFNGPCVAAARLQVLH